MKKGYRLRKNHEFQKVISSRKSEVSKHLVIYYLPNNKKRTQYGISVSKKFTNAVGRNKLRRQVRAMLDRIDLFKKSLDVVIILRKPFMTSRYEVKKASLEKILKRIQ